MKIETVVQKKFTICFLIRGEKLLKIATNLTMFYLMDWCGIVIDSRLKI
jgi:hypothetical protein